MKAAKGEELRLAILRTSGKCAIRAYKDGVGFTSCGAPATLAVVTRGAMADATCDVHFKALTGVTP
jgi:hypothetical protein